MFSAGLIMFNILTGAYLFEGTLSKDIIESNKLFDKESVEKKIRFLPPKARSLFRKLINENPSLRPTPQ